MNNVKKRILVIDDEEGIRKSFVLALEDTEYEVDTAESGEKGIEMAKKQNYDLIFLDLKMPGQNGVQTLRALRKIDRDALIYITSAFYEEFSLALKSAEKEGIDFELMRKPLNCFFLTEHGSRGLRIGNENQLVTIDRKKSIKEEGG